jgi:CO dehydrogenase maturation factor
LDNEAGLENLSRRIAQKVNVMCLVSDASNSGLETLKRLYELAAEMGVEYDKLALIINRVRGGRLPAKAEEVRSFTKADFVLAIPDDGEIAEFAEAGRSLLELPGDNPVNETVSGFVREIIL